MKINIRNLSKKKRSKVVMNDLKSFTAYIAFELDVAPYINKIKLTYRDNWTGYYPKGKPLAGFFKSYNNGTVQIDFTDFWDRNKQDRYSAIVHELTHAKQMIERRLVVNANGKSLKWDNKLCDTWKNWNEEVYSKIEDVTLARRYMWKRMPWEREVGKNIDKYCDREFRKWDK